MQPLLHYNVFKILLGLVESDLMHLVAINICLHGVKAFISVVILQVGGLLGLINILPQLLEFIVHVLEVHNKLFKRKMALATIHYFV